MSCNGCRVLRRGCSDECILRPCLDWIQTPQAQANATQFVSKFFGRTDLMSFISAVPENKRPALFQSLLFEACGRTVNPVSGAVGLVSTGNWHVCQAAVDLVLAGGELRPLSGGIFSPSEARKPASLHGSAGGTRGPAAIGRRCVENTASFGSGFSELTPEFGRGGSSSSSSIGNGVSEVGRKKPKLLNLFG